MTLTMDLGKSSYDITIERSALSRAGEIFDLDRKVLVVTDSGVPYKYSQTLASQCRESYVVVVEQGEINKSIVSYTYISKMLLKYGFTRTDAIVAVGGGVVTDLAGFAASTYMRGIDFYNVPTTLLSQIDASIGGKVAIDFGGVKNIIGAFYQPKGVIIDPELLSSLSRRQLFNGAAEAVKMAITFDPELFTIFEQGRFLTEIDSVIEKSLIIKKRVVEEDEREKGLRRVLNFGHTVGHAVESASSGKLLHGEAVSVGMIPMCDFGIRGRVTNTLAMLGLPISTNVEFTKAIQYIAHDKKADGSSINVVYATDIGSFEIRKMPVDEYIESIREVYPYKL